MKLYVYLALTLRLLQQSTLIGVLKYFIYLILKKKEHISLTKKKYNKKFFSGIGIIGAGNYVASIHLPILKKINYPIYGITSKGLKSASILSDIYRVNLLKSFDELLNNEKIDSYLIATPHNFHYEHLVKTINENKYIYLEKPVAINLQHLKDIEEKIIDHPNAHKVMIGFNRRFAKAVQKLKKIEWIKNRKNPIEIQYRINFGKKTDNDMSDPIVGGGRLHGVVCHYVDLICYLVGQNIINVNSFSISNKNFDTINILVQFEDFSLGTITFSSEGDRYKGIKEEIKLTSGGHYASINDFSKLVIDNKKYVYFKDNFGSIFAMKEFLNSKINNLPTPISLRDGLRASKLTFAIQESILSKKIIKFKKF